MRRHMPRAVNNRENDKMEGAVAREGSVNEEHMGVYVGS